MPQRDPVRRPPSMFIQFFQGVADVMRGAHFIFTRPALWIWALIPFLLNIALFTLLAWLIWHFAGGWINGRFTSHGFWLALAGWVLRLLVWLAFGLLVFFIFVPLASLIASPFNDVLSEKVERLYAGLAAGRGFSLGGMMKGMALSLHSSLRLTLVSIVLLGLALPLNLIPGFGSALWTAASAAITIRFLSLQFTAYSMDRRFYTYARRREFLRRHRARTIGLGAMAFVIMLVPVLNALFISVSAVAGTLLFCDTQGE